jgi:4-oxalocrotonate tautomerase family enzyme
MPVIQCDIREGRTEEEKQTLAQEITRVVHETIGAPVEYIYVLIRETPGSHHIKAGRPLVITHLKADEAKAIIGLALFIEMPRRVLLGCPASGLVSSRDNAPLAQIL